MIDHGGSSTNDAKDSINSWQVGNIDFPVSPASFNVQKQMANNSKNHVPTPTVEMLDRVPWGGGVNGSSSANPNPETSSDCSPRSSEKLTAWQLRERTKYEPPASPSISMKKILEWSPDASNHRKKNGKFPSPTIDMLQRKSWGRLETNGTSVSPLQRASYHGKATARPPVGPLNRASYHGVPTWKLRESTKFEAPKSPLIGGRQALSKRKCNRHDEQDPFLPPFFRVVCTCNPEQKCIYEQKEKDKAAKKKSHMQRRRPNFNSPFVSTGKTAGTESRSSTSLPPPPPPPGPPPTELSPVLSESSSKRTQSTLSYSSIHSSTSSCGDCSTEVEEESTSSFLSDDESEFETSSLSTCEIDCAKFDMIAPDQEEVTEDAIKRSVDFEELELVIVIPSREDIKSEVDEEDEAMNPIWWSKDDLYKIRVEVNDQAKRLNSGDVDRIGDSTCCPRGLEGLMDDIAKQRQKNRSIVTRAVLETQRYQRTKHGKVLHPELIAEICTKCSAKSQLDAQELARRDAEEVTGDPVFMDPPGIGP